MNSVFNILQSWNYRFELGLCWYAIKFGKNLFSEDIWDLNFTFLIQLFEMVWATIHKYVESPVLVACQWLLMLTWFPIISISLFFLGAVFYMKRLRSGTDLIKCELELHGWVSRMPCPILSHMGNARGGRLYWTVTQCNCWFEHEINGCMDSFAVNSAAIKASRQLLWRKAGCSSTSELDCSQYFAMLFNYRNHLCNTCKKMMQYEHYVQ